MSMLVLEPPERVAQLQQIATAQHTTPENLLNKAVVEFIKRSTVGRQRSEKQAGDLDISEFEREVANFERMKPELLERYAGHAVAIYQGQVIASGDNILDVYDSALQKYGPIRCYVQWVETNSPRTVRIPTRWKTQDCLRQSL